ncbi:MAG: helix-turn-helix domain-containing protein [Vagococcus sp.]
MRELLDAPTQRRLHILEQLNEVSDWISSNELAKENNASLRTINNDVSFLKDNWYPHLLIETSKKNGVRLITQPSSHVEVVYRYVLKKSEAFRLLESMFFNTTLSIEKWGEKLFISESSLYRITNAMAESLNRYGLVLEKKPCRILGVNEFYVRFFYTSFFREAYSITEWPFPSDKKKSIEFTKNILLALNSECDENQIIHLNHTINVSLVRQSQGFFIDHAPDFHFSKKMYDTLLKNKLPLEDMAMQYGLKVNEKLVTDLLYAIFYHRHCWESKSEQLMITKEIEQFVKTLRDVFDLKLSNELSEKLEGTMKHLYLYHTIYPFRNYIIYDHYFYNGLAIKEQFPVFNQVIEQALLKMEKNTGFPWYTSFHYVVLYWVMIKWNDLPSILESKKQKASILVMSHLGKDHSEFLTKIIKKNFGDKINIVSYDDSIIFLDQTSESDFDDYHIIVTTFNTDLLPLDKLVVVDDIPSNNDWGTIRHAVQHIYQIQPNKLNYSDIH